MGNDVQRHRCTMNNARCTAFSELRDCAQDALRTQGSSTHPHRPSRHAAFEMTAVDGPFLRSLPPSTAFSRVRDDRIDGFDPIGRRLLAARAREDVGPPAVRKQPEAIRGCADSAHHDAFGLDCHRLCAGGGVRRGRGKGDGQGAMREGRCQG